MTEFSTLLKLLCANDVDFILIGGLAALMHGSARTTNDVDIVYSRSPENVSRLVNALSGLHPYLRGVPPGLPFRWDGETVLNGLNFTLVTDAGDIDLLGEVTGGGFYEQLLPYSNEAESLGCRFKIVRLDKLIHLKRCAGRPKDLVALSELEALLQEQSNSQGS